MHAGPLPVVVGVNLEPDVRVTTNDGSSTWDGVDPTMALVEEWRASDPAIPVTWLWRCDAAIAQGFGDPGWALRRWQPQIVAAIDRGDEVGVHPHLWRWSDPLKTFVSDAANDAWKALSIRTAADTFQREIGVPVRTSQMGDGYFDPPILRALVDGGFTVDLTIEPGGKPRTHMVHTEFVTGTMPDRRRTPHRPFRPSWKNPCRPGRHAAPLWALPLTTAATPLVVDGVVVDDVGTPANLGTDPYRFHHIVATGLDAAVAAGHPVLTVLVRSDVGTHPAQAAHTARNLEWLRLGMRGLADRWGGVEFVTPHGALDRLGCRA